ncbi:hypothetical protein CEXT_178991 [Caerostris extrusa]|uniref:Uncharacterized protein n=1 Tax=Caerostris extrusa TaxID=172846 RepID=A0AAV4RXW3_CAEEX|nr:hypothetical protein CEXT_178991 [Caerostris extrusa]
MKKLLIKKPDSDLETHKFPSIRETVFQRESTCEPRGPLSAAKGLQQRIRDPADIHSKRTKVTALSPADPLARVPDNSVASITSKGPVPEGWCHCSSLYSQAIAHTECKHDVNRNVRHELV